MQKSSEAAVVEEKKPSAPPPPAAPPELKVAMVVRGFRGHYGGVVHLAPRVNALALCGAGYMKHSAKGANESDVCQVCAALAKGAHA